MAPLVRSSMRDGRKRFCDSDENVPTCSLEARLQKAISLQARRNLSS